MTRAFHAAEDAFSHGFFLLLLSVVVLPTIACSETSTAPVSTDRDVQGSVGFDLVIPRQEAPESTELSVAAIQPVPGFLLPERARPSQDSGRQGLYEISTSLERLAAFYVAEGFLVTHHPQGFTVRSSASPDRLEVRDMGHRRLAILFLRSAQDASTAPGDPVEMSSTVHAAVKERLSTGSGPQRSIKELLPEGFQD